MQIEATGKSVEIAIQNGLLECGMKREDVSVKVIEEGGLFKKAKVVLTWGEEEKVEETDETPVVEETEQEETTQVQTEEVEQSEKAVEEEQVEKKKRIVDSTRIQEKGKEFLLGLAKMLDENATCEVSVNENEVSFSLKGENLGKLIGFHGDNLQALQVLLSGLKTRGEGAIRLFLDVDGYKANRNQAIVDLANKTAEQAIKIERNIHLDPMNAYERRIVHTTLQEREDVTTESTGEGEKRHVVVKPIFKR
ncbi:MAG: KH domain-containing protein [Clostridia bacterium]|nr:KH domain-containing protein [Clostridia bacterium]